MCVHKDIWRSTKWISELDISNTCNFVKFPLEFILTINIYCIFAGSIANAVLFLFCFLQTMESDSSTDLDDRRSWRPAKSSSLPSISEIQIQRNLSTELGSSNSNSLPPASEDNSSTSSSGAIGRESIEEF